LRSIRRQLTTGLLVSLFLLIALCGGALYGVLRTSLVGEYDGALLAKARALATLAERESNGKMEFDFADEFMPEFGHTAAPEYFEIWLEDGQVLERSRSLGSQDLPRRADIFAKPLFWNMPLPDGRRGRAVGILFVPQKDIEGNENRQEEGPLADGGPQVTLVVARSREQLAQTLHLLSIGIGGVGLLLPVGIALIVAALIGRGLRPLDRMGAEATSIDSSSLQYRFADSEMPRELRPICMRLNDLLERLENAFARERRFTGDAAHELRTPIAELRSLAEVAMRHPEDTELCRRTLTEAVAIARQMERLVTTLLALARGETGAQQVACEPIDLGDVLQQAWAPFEQRASERQLSLTWEVPTALPSETDRALLHCVLGNLFSNAVAHSPVGGQITVRAQSHDGTVRLLIVNTSSSLTREDVPHLFEPFWQKDPSRTDSTQSGLGLSLVAVFCRLMNVGVSARLTDGNQLAFELIFPRSRQATAPVT